MSSSRFSTTGRCRADGCERPIQARGACSKHYRRLWKFGTFSLPEKKEKAACVVDGCDMEVLARSKCAKHYRLWRNQSGVSQCTIQDCAKGAIARGLCNRHYHAAKTYGDPLHRKIRERGTGYITKQGYVYVFAPEHQNANASGGILEHRLVMSTVLGRPLFADENVHHKNGVRSDNRSENLELWTTMQPSGKRIHDLLEYAKEILRRYDTEKV